ncbi:MAG: MBOAT family protein [Armatimonadetes bacterium]|nr:MBOAT family protein [Armatimonadota bacterium]
MLFNTWQFALFFLAVYPLYLIAAFRIQTIGLLAASWFFYACWDWRFLFLLLTSTTVDYYIGKRLAVCEDAGQRRRLVTVSIATNLTFLGFFKYYNFFTDSAVGLLRLMGIEAHPWLLHVVLPVGISFYTFQAMAYTIDVYRDRSKTCSDFVTFALYVAYFPHLVAGPIQRTDDLLPQLARPRKVSWDQIGSGAVLVLVGLARKALADRLAPYVDLAFNAPLEQSSLILVRGVVAFALQIYGDFAGYTDIARGISRMMGIELIQNFRWPYLSRNVQEFWQRWHISLSRWLRDYLYIPLGGNRGSRAMIFRNLMITMLLGGLWHGASWNFVVWGGIHGVALVVHRVWLYLLQQRRAGREQPEPPDRADRLAFVASWALTLAVVLVTGVFFRAHTFADAMAVLSGIVHWHGPLAVKRLGGLAGLLVALALIDGPQVRAGEHEACRRWPWVLQGLYYAFLVLLIVMVRPSSNAPFLYFQF